MNLETKITIYKFTPQLFTLTQRKLANRENPLTQNPLTPSASVILW